MGWGRKQSPLVEVNTLRTEMMWEAFQEVWPFREEDRIRQKPE